MIRCKVTATDRENVCANWDIMGNVVTSVYLYQAASMVIVMLVLNVSAKKVGMVYSVLNVSI